MAGLPQYLMGQANGWDFTPIENALAKYADQQRWQAQQAMAQQRMGMDQQRLGFEQQRLGFDRDRAMHERQMEPERLKLLRAQIGQQNEELAHKREMRPYQTYGAYQDIEMKKAQMDQLRQKDALDQVIMQSFGGGQTPPTPPRMRPMSAPGGAPLTPIPTTMPADGDPMLIPTQSAAPSQEPTVNTPLGPMTQSKAKQLGFIMAYRGKGEAGKMLAESQTALGKEAKNENDKRELNTIELASRLNHMTTALQDKFLTLPEQFLQRGISLRARLTGELPPHLEKSRAEFVTFQQNVLTHLNAYIKEITGAAMTDGEAKRITAASPNMDDDPVAFRAKINVLKRNTGLAIARYRYLRERGFNGMPWNGDIESAAKAFSIERMGDIIRQDAQGLLREIRAKHPDAPDVDVNAAVRALIRQRYGLDA